MTTFYTTRTATRMPARPAFRAAAPSVIRPIPADLYRDGDRYVVSADLPGIDPASVDIAVDGRTLSIRAERTAPRGEGVAWVSRERQAGSFSRRFTLGESIDTDRIAAKYANGVLDVTLPVIEKTKPRTIRIEGVPAASAEPATAEEAQDGMTEQDASTEQVGTTEQDASTEQVEQVEQAA